MTKALQKNTLNLLSAICQRVDVMQGEIFPPQKSREIQFDLSLKRAPAKHGIDCNYAVSILFPTGLQMNHFPLIADASLQCVIF